MKIVSMEGLLKELPCGTALLAARAHHREDPFVPLAAPLRTAALREPPLEYDTVETVPASTRSNGYGRLTFAD